MQSSEIFVDDAGIAESITHDGEGNGGIASLSGSLFVKFEWNSVNNSLNSEPGFSLLRSSCLVLLSVNYQNPAIC